MQRPTLTILLKYLLAFSFVPYISPDAFKIVSGKYAELSNEAIDSIQATFQRENYLIEKHKELLNSREIDEAGKLEALVVADLSFHPVDWSSLYIKGMHLFHRGKLDESIPLLESVCVSDGYNTEHYVTDTAAALVASNNIERAIYILREGVSRLPKSFPAHSALINTLSSSGRHREALLALINMIRELPEKYDLWKHLKEGFVVHFEEQIRHNQSDWSLNYTGYNVIDFSIYHYNQ
jgi:tetratricopeptide (TPR) repeat protein